MAKRTGFSQANMPQFPIREAIELAKSLQDNYAGQDATPIDLAKSVGRSPTSSAWRALTSAAVSYGLTVGTFNAKTIALAPLGRKIVAPTEEGEDKGAILTSLLQPTILKSFYEKYDGNKLPKEEIAKNVLEQMGVPKDKIDDTYSIVIENAQYAGILSSVNGNLYIQLRSARSSSPVAQAGSSEIAQQTSLTGNTSTQQQVAHSTQPIPVNTAGLVIISIIPGELGIAVSPSLQSKTWLNQELTEKMTAITNAARDYAREWKKQTSSDNEQTGG